MPPLVNLIATQEGTRSDVMAAVWKLVKITGAQDKDDGTILRPVGGLERVSRNRNSSSADHFADHATWARRRPVPSAARIGHSLPDSS